jgi:hypothetical protein
MHLRFNQFAIDATENENRHFIVIVGLDPTIQRFHVNLSLTASGFPLSRE